MAPFDAPQSSARKRQRVDSSPEPEQVATQAQTAQIPTTSQSSAVKQDPENTPDIAMHEAHPDAEKRCASLWFGDGNVVIRCRGVSFRVHRSLLSRASDTFLETVEEEVVRAEYAGCTVLSLEEDYPFDVEHFLLAIYEEKRCVCT